MRNAFFPKAIPIMQVEGNIVGGARFIYIMEAVLAPVV
jgi:hypothetical protein